MGANTKLFQDFKSVSLTEWETKLEKDLKGKPLTSLHFKPEFDLEVKAYYHPEEFKNQAYSKGSQLNNNNNDWAISQAFTDHDSLKTNGDILKALNVGVSGLKITLTENSNLQLLLQDVLVEHIFTHFICLSSDIYKRLVQFLNDTNTHVSMIEMPFLTCGLLEGSFALNQLDIDNFVEDSETCCVKNIVVDSHSFCEFGASTAQELGIALAQYNEYLQRLNNQKVSFKSGHQKMAMHIGITDQYFVNIAKVRAIKELVLQLQAQWDMETDTMPWVSAETVERHMTLNDRHNNVLRHTTSAMSAALGGVNQLIVQPYSNHTNNDNELATRLAKNVQLILKDEAYFNQVIDPSAGAYAIEALTDQLINKAWEYFMQIEAQGGYYDAIENGWIQELIQSSVSAQIEALNSDKKTLLGVNKFQNSTEKWQNSEKKVGAKSSDFIAFKPFNLESHYKKQAV